MLPSKCLIAAFLAVASTAFSVPRSASAQAPAQTADLARYAGEYRPSFDPNGPPFVLAVEGGKLVAKVPGAPDHPLVALGDGTFKLEGAPEGFKIRFRLQDNKVTGLELEQGDRGRLELNKTGS